MSAGRLLFALPGNEAFARRLAGELAADVEVVETRRFPDGESYVRLPVEPAGRVVDLVCTLAQPDERFLALVFAADAARELGARQVNLVAPYLAYMRQDCRFRPGESVSSVSFARLVSSTFDRLVTVDPHLHRHHALSNVYTIRADALQSAPLLAEWIGANVARPLVVGPDEESEQWAGAIAARIGAPHVVLKKVRHGDRDVEIALPEFQRWQGCQPVLVDDIASSGRTLAVAARGLVQQGFPRPVCVVVHALFGGDAFQMLSPLCGRIVSTDAVPHPTNAIALAPLIAAALRGPAPE
ncbi:MAG: ribose-phosphate pyrophosphokinase [Pseudomonadota bacterium]|jgi:ribose-phosphate pyrophosphokinase|nr:MAG: phosphoribosylpyrophosphate synthetase [Pseudomonadota bacterium]